MIRYDIKCDPGPLPAKGDRRIQINETDNGQWVRYEDVEYLRIEVSELREALKSQVCAWPITNTDHPAYRLAYPAPDRQENDDGT